MKLWILDKAHGNFYTLALIRSNKGGFEVWFSLDASLSMKQKQDKRKTSFESRFVLA